MASSPGADATRRRREKRRQLDARRSKCRIRLGGHMERWCLLKERLGFALHSQLAKFLLDRSASPPRPGLRGLWAGVPASPCVPRAVLTTRPELPASSLWQVHLCRLRALRR